MSYQVITRDGRTLTLRDDEICPDGCSLLTPMQFMDGVRRSVAQGFADEFPITDEMAQACVDARAQYIDRLSKGMHRHRVTIDQAYADAVVEAMDSDPDFHPGRYAYDQMKKRLSDAYKRVRP